MSISTTRMVGFRLTPTPGCSPSLVRACEVSASPTSPSLLSLALHAFGIARRVQPIVVAASVGVAAMLVGFAVYPASMPSWWNAALGLASGWLVLRWLDNRKPWVLGAAGGLTGLSFLVKSTGAFVAAAIALYLIMLISPDSPRRRVLVALGALIVLSFGVLLAGASVASRSRIALCSPGAWRRSSDFEWNQCRGCLAVGRYR